jgi:hypothetical protein
VKKIGHPPDGPVLAFSPDAKTLAVGGTGRTVLLDLTSGEVWAVAAPLVTPGKEKVITLRAYTLPHPEVQAKIDKKLARPGVFALRPGDAVTIDVFRGARGSPGRGAGGPGPAGEGRRLPPGPGGGGRPCRHRECDRPEAAGDVSLLDQPGVGTDRARRAARPAEGGVGERRAGAAPGRGVAPRAVRDPPQARPDGGGPGRYAGKPDYRLYDRKLPAVVSGPAAVAGRWGGAPSRCPASRTASPGSTT